MLLCAAAGSAQEARETQLKTVEVEAERIVEKADGRLIFPSEAQKAASANGYSMLAKLALPGIRIDEMMRSITALGSQGTVQVRLNGAVATKEELLAMDPKLIKNIDFIDNPGLRYGTDVAYVINIRTRRHDQGYTLGLDLSNSLTAWNGNNTVYGELNSGKSALGLTYVSDYRDFRGSRYSEQADYLLTDGTHYLMTREDAAARSRGFGNSLQLRYNLADSAAYVFQVKLSGNFRNQPNSDKSYLTTEPGNPAEEAFTRSRSHAFTPVLDLYFFHRLGQQQSLTANMVGTMIATDQSNRQQEGQPYAYEVDGKTRSLFSEAIYENILKPFTLSFGLQHQWKYTRNIYTGDAAATNSMHNSLLHLFGEIKGRWQRLFYTAGMGVSNTRYRQSSNRYNYWLFRPKATVGYTFFRGFNARYTLETYQHISKIAMISDTRVRRNSMEWTVGNPDIKPNRVVSNQLRFSYDKPRVTAQINMEYRMNVHCNLADYERTADNQFLYTQKNQSSIRMFYAQGYTSLTIIPDRLTVSANGGIYRFINRGNTYRHNLTSYNYAAYIQAFLGRWTLTAYADNGWKFMEGETWSKQGSATYLGAGYRLGDCRISLFWQHPLVNNPRMEHGALVNRYLQKAIESHSSDLGNMLTLNISWKLNRGKHRQDIEKKLDNQDTQTGILTH